MNARKQPLKIAETARRYAMKYKAPLGRYCEGCGSSTGFYFLSLPGGKKSHVSTGRTAKDAIAMMIKAGFKP